jgi:YD repeat-containing protein
MRNLVQEKDVNDGSENPVAKTKYGYDENVTTEPGSPFGYTTPTHSKLGNLTSKTASPDATSPKWTTTYARDNLGNVLSITDPRTHVTTISYTDSCSAGPGGTLDAFPTLVTNPLSQA